MKKCHNCGAQLDDNTMFCSECGTKQMPKPKKEMKLSEKKYELQLGDLVVIIPDAPKITLSSLGTHHFSGFYFVEGVGFLKIEDGHTLSIREVNGVPVKMIDSKQDNIHYNKYEEQ